MGRIKGEMTMWSGMQLSTFGILILVFGQSPPASGFTPGIQVIVAIAMMICGSIALVRYVRAEQNS